MPGPSVNVISRDYQWGLAHSRALAAEALEAGGFQVRVLGGDQISQWTQAQFEEIRSTPFDFNIFLEAFYPALFSLGRRQLFIPNQEWFAAADAPHLKLVDAVICKTMHAQEIFAQLGCRTVYSGFTSRDCKLPTAEPMRRDFLSLNAKQHSSPRVLDVWRRHPEWPHLTIMTDEWVPQITAPNIRHIKQFLPAEQIKQFQNEHLFHICMSRTEGFGHKLNEAMSCGAIVITTDAPPMNELIEPDRGFLVGFIKSEPQGLGVAFDFDKAGFEEKVEACIGLSAGEIQRLSTRARGWFEENDRAFRARFPDVVRALG